MLCVVPKHVPVPPALKAGPFTLADAAAAGLERWHLDTSRYRRLGLGTYAWAELPVTPELRLAAARLHLPPTAVFGGRTAAWLHRLDWTFVEPIEVILPTSVDIKGRAGLRISRAGLQDHEVVIRRRTQVTSVVRTLLDLGRRLPLAEAVMLADVALHQTLTSVADLDAAVLEVGGSRNVQQLRRVLLNVEPLSESHMESLLRMLLVEAGLPRPQAQVALRDGTGHFLGRADLYYPSHRLALEYDGGNHRDSLVKDDRRQNLLLEAGYTIRRFTAPDLRATPDLVVAMVRAELSRPPRWSLAA